MAAPTRTKSLLETKAFPLDIAALLPPSPTIASVQMTASRTSPFPLQPTTLAQAGILAVGSNAIQLHANPQSGALLILEPGTGAEEKLKVLSVTGVSDPWTANVIPETFVAHNSAVAVSYEPGMNARLFINPTPTAVGTVITPFIQKGAWNQNYRISYIVVTGTGTRHEDEFTLQVVDKASTNSEIKQPSEIVDIAGGFEKLLEEPHHATATLNSAVLYVSNLINNTPPAQLAAQANAGISTITLNAHPGIGAVLTLTPAGTGNPPPERVYVTNVTGAGPTYTVTIFPDLEFQHSNGVDVTVCQGYNTTFLTSTNATAIVGKAVIHRAQRGQAGKTLKLVWLGTTSQAEVLSTTGLCSLEET